MEKLSDNRQGIILGQNQLTAINKRVGDRFTLFGISNFRGIDLEFEIVATFPIGRYDSLAAFHRDYFNNELDSYERRTGRKHPLADRRMNLVWLKVADTEAFNRVAAQIESSPLYSNPAVKCETASSGIASFLDAFRDLIWGMRWLLAPACILTLSMLMANAIGISVRERRMEMAIMKVIGFRPYQILLLVLTRIAVAGDAGWAAECRTDLHDRELGVRRSEVPDCLLRCVSDSRSTALWWGRGVSGPWPRWWAVSFRRGRLAE